MILLVWWSLISRWKRRTCRSWWYLESNLLVHLTRLSRNLELNLLLTICHLYRDWLTIDMNMWNWMSMLHLLSRLPIDQHLRNTRLSRLHLLTRVDHSNIWHTKISSRLHWLALGVNMNVWHAWLPDLHMLAINHNLLTRLNWLTVHQYLLLNTWLSRCLSIDPHLWHVWVSWRVDLLHRLVVDPYLRWMLMGHIIDHLMYLERRLQICCEADALLHRHLCPIDLMQSLCLLYNFEQLIRSSIQWFKRLRDDLAWMNLPFEMICSFDVIFQLVACLWLRKLLKCSF